jgi:mercuric ion transport protein
MSATRAEASEATRQGPTSAALRRDRDRTQRLIAAGGILGALGAASCCVLPFALFLAGVSGAWIGNLTALEPYQPIFAIVSLGFVGYGAWCLYLRPKRACADGYCAAP